MKLNEEALINKAKRTIISTNEELRREATQLSTKTENQHFALLRQTCSKRSVNLPVYAAHNVISDDDHESPAQFPLKI
jgi:UDP-N-acetylmuramate-alanine ligase